MKFTFHSFFISLLLGIALVDASPVRHTPPAERDLESHCAAAGQFRQLPGSACNSIINAPAAPPTSPALAARQLLGGKNRAPGGRLGEILQLRRVQDSSRVPHAQAAPPRISAAAPAARQLQSKVPGGNDRTRTPGDLLGGIPQLRNVQGDSSTGQLQSKVPRGKVKPGLLGLGFLRRRGNSPVETVSGLCSDLSQFEQQVQQICANADPHDPAATLSAFCQIPLLAGAPFCDPLAA